MNTISRLKYPPIKHKFPRELIYHNSNRYNGIENSDVYTIFKIDKPKQFARLCCLPATVDRDGQKNVKSLYIWRLFSSPVHSGLGTKALDFAKTVSKKDGCNGYFHLDAHGGFTPHCIPHIFYKKYGMNTESDVINKKMDKFIKKKKYATYKDFKNLMMFYPPIEKPITRFQQIINFIFPVKNKI